MKKQGIPAPKIAAVYMSTVVGAGFATGQEVLQFFGRFGVAGFWGILLAAALFFAFGLRIMRIGKALGAVSHLQVVQSVSGKLADLLDAAIGFFLLGALATMIAGNAALFSQLGIPAFWGAAFMAAISAVTVLAGLEGLVNSMSVVTPMLLLAVLAMTVLSLSSPAAPDAIRPTVPAFSSLPFAVLYVSYNILLSVSVLSALGGEARDDAAVIGGSLLGGLGLGTGTAAILLCLLRAPSSAVQSGVPMLTLAGMRSPYLQMAYAVALSAEIYSTAASSLYGLTARITNRKNAPKWRLFIFLISIAALALSFLGFVSLVKYLYPVVGICGFVLLICLAFTKRSPTNR